MSADILRNKLAELYKYRGYYVIFKGSKRRII